MDRKQRSELLKGREVRLSSTLLECRDADGGMAIRGYASTTGQAYDMGWYSETIARGAFTKTLSENPDVQLLINHGGLPLARTTNGTLTLREDQSGLYFEAQMDAEDSDAAKIARKIEAGLMDQCSFAFRVTRQTWDSDYENRSIDEVSLDRGDVSVVNYGANPHTSVSLRSFFADLADLDDEKLAELREDPTVITVLRKLQVPAAPAEIVEVIEPIVAIDNLALFRARAQALKFRQK
jgi:HK97 family phage prohead protease